MHEDVTKLEVSAENRESERSVSAPPPLDSSALDAQREATRSAHAFDTLLAQYRDLSDSQRQKGNLFEQLIRTYLLNDSQMARQFARVYSWRDWPGRLGAPDTGIDLVAIEHKDMPDGGVVLPSTPAVAIQCKFYEQGKTIQKAHLDSFLSDSGKEPFTRRIFVETTGVPWGVNAEAAVVGQTKPVSRIGLTDLRNSDIDWSTYSLAQPEDTPDKKPRKTLRDHQVTAIEDVFNGFKEHDRGILVMACGTGKTFTSLKIAERLAEENGGNARIMFMVPSLALMSQTLQEWNEEVEIPFSAWSVCSDTKVNRRRRNTDDLADLATVDLKTPPTTDAANLSESLVTHRHGEGLEVVFCTYQSIDIVHQAQELAGDDWQDFDLIICDEAHRTTGVTLSGNDESAFVRVHNDQYVRADKRLYMTATPRVYQPHVKNAAKENDAVLASMDDVDLFGPMFHRLSFGAAVNLKLLTDYKVVVLVVPEDQIKPIYQQDAEYGELSIPDTAKLAGCWNALAKRRNGFTDVQYGTDNRPMRRAVAFAKDIKTSKQITAEFPELVRRSLQDLTNDETSDDLEVQCEHVDGSMNAIERGEALDWLKEDIEEKHPVCRILTNARCLSEGVDVPTLDAVMFLNPRKSQVDVIQAVGRVMRKAEGKEFGYIILPVAVPLGVKPEEALNDNKRFQVVWQVLQAIRAHDDRFDTQVNAIEFNKARPENIVIDVVDFSRPGRNKPFEGEALSGSFESSDSSAREGSGSEDAANAGGPSEIQLPLFTPSEWKDAVFSKIVKKVGNRLYWDDWSKDIADIAGRYISLIDQLLDDADNQALFGDFVEALQTTLNPSIDNAQAVEMLAQHLITKPLFDAMFPDQSFTEQNPVSRAMQGILDKLATNKVFENERAPLAKFYETMAEKISAIDNLAGKQNIMRTLYDKFFTKAFPAMQDRLGIVFTPVQVVDYILHSAEAAMQHYFKKSLADEGVAIIDPFLGTGTFVSRLLQSGIIPPERLEDKYRNEIFANEIVLLSYYIASINIEEVYHEIRLEQGFADEYVEFPGITLTDTFQMREEEDQLDVVGDFQTNIERVKRQREAPIRVIVMNPPYSAGQRTANDNNQNLKYPNLDTRIEETYAARSTATNKNSLYDSYMRSLRWATDRIGDEGVIAFVSNSSFIDGNTADGVRLTWQDEFSEIYVYNLRGNARTQGERRRQEGDGIFGEGSRTGVAITILVKRRNQRGQAKVYYSEVDDYLSRREKLNILTDEISVEETLFDRIVPNVHGDWVNQRDDAYLDYQEIGDAKTKGKSDSGAVFILFSGGLKTNRDVWCYGFSRSKVAGNMQRMIGNYNSQVSARKTSKTADIDPTKLSWNRQLFKDLDREKTHQFNDAALQLAVYRPFMKQIVYFDRSMNDMIYQMPRIFPSQRQPNIAFGAIGRGATSGFSLLMTPLLPDLEFVSKAQWFPLYTWEPIEDDGSMFSLSDGRDWAETATEFSGVFDFSKPISQQVPMEVDGYRRVDNITDATLTAYRHHYQDILNPEGEKISKEDIFFYVYALLHHPEYREKYEADLKKMLPRIPKVKDFWAYSNIGRVLADLHVNYERAHPYPSVHMDWSLHTPEDVWKKYHVEKLAWGKLPGKRSKDFTTLIFNDYLTIRDIPAEANDYKVGGRSPLEWMVDRYRIKTDKKSGITNDPNDYCKEINDPAYIADLVGKLVTVSMSTQELLRALPDLVIEE